MKELIVMIGLPRSGKSTYVDKYCQKYDIICADDIRLAMGTQFDPKLEPFVWAVHDTMLRALMIRGRSIVLDETTTVMSRIDKAYFLCQEYGYTIKLIYMDTSIEECIKRNTEAGSFPEEVIYRMNDQLQELLDLLNHCIHYEYTTIE